MNDLFGSAVNIFVAFPDNLPVNSEHPAPAMPLALQEIFTMNPAPEESSFDSRKEAQSITVPYAVRQMTDCLKCLQHHHGIS